MIAKSVEKYLRISPRKIRQVITLVKGKSADAAISILSNLNKRAAKFLLAGLKSAVNNAQRKTEGKVDTSRLYISKMTADGGPMLKRFKAASMGRAVMIRRRTSHITTELDLRELPKIKTEKKQSARKSRRLLPKRLSKRKVKK